MFKDFLTFITEEDGRSITVQNGVVTSTAQPTPVKNNPDGWQDTSIGFERKLTDGKLGNLRSFTLPLSFIRNEARILRKAAYSLKRNLYLIITRLKIVLDSVTSTYTPLYEHLYKGQIDWTTFEDAEFKVKVSFGEGGVQKQVTANESTMYEIPIDTDPEAVVVKMDGIFLNLTQNFIIPDWGQLNILDNGNHQVGVSPTNKEGEAGGFAVFPVYADSSTPNDYTTDVNYFFLTSQVITGIQFKGSVSIKVVNAGHTYLLRLKTSTGRIINLINVNVPDTGDHTYTFDVTFDSIADERFFLDGNYGSAGSSGIIYTESSAFVKFKSRYLTTYVKGLKVSTLAKRLAALSTGSAANVDVSYLQNLDHLIILSGDAVRSLPKSVIKTKWSDFFKFCLVVDGVGNGFESGKLIFQPYTYFLKTTNPIALGSASDLTVTPAVDLMANTVKIGYTDQTIDDVNGKSEFNNTHLYTSDITDVSKELNLVSSYLAQPYYIELKRINLDQKTTTDSEIDNDIIVLNTTSSPVDYTANDILFDHTLGYFFVPGALIGAMAQYFIPGRKIVVSGTQFNDITVTVDHLVFAIGGVNVFVPETLQDEVVNSLVTFSTTLYELRRNPYVSITGVPDAGSIYNIELSPKRLMAIHARWLASIFPAGSTLKFSTTEKNADLVTNDGTTVITEKADFNVTAPPLFKPWYFAEEVRTPINLVAELEVDPNRPFTTDWFDNDLKGFLVKGAICPDNLKPQQYKLLCTPDTDITKLIR